MGELPRFPGLAQAPSAFQPADDETPLTDDARLNSACLDARE
jgi:hypothetical protein